MPARNRKRAFCILMPKKPAFHKRNDGGAKRVARKSYDRYRGSSAKRGYGHKWRKESAEFLEQAENAFCAGAGCNELSTVVDHIVPHKGDQKLFWRRSNWQGMCKPCHDAKTAREDGGFGRPVRGVGQNFSPPLA